MADQVCFEDDFYVAFIDLIQLSLEAPRRWLCDRLSTGCVADAVFGADLSFSLFRTDGFFFRTDSQR